jgi:nitrogen-specific signal transduction histidine kinase
MEVLSLNDAVESTTRMLARLLGESIQIQMHLDANLWVLSGDRGQIDQVLVNLAVNARDAMPGGGVLRFETKNLTVPASGDHRLPPGEWVQLSVSDNGIGMDETVQLHIFEPFFTTKPAGIGTGLGLSVVFGIITRGICACGLPPARVRRSTCFSRAPSTFAANPPRAWCAHRPILHRVTKRSCSPKTTWSRARPR